MRRNGLGLAAVAFALLALPARAEEPQLPAPKEMKPALLVIDVQNEFLPMMSDADKKLAPMMINGAIWLFANR